MAPNTPGRFCSYRQPSSSEKHSALQWKTGKHTTLHTERSPQGRSMGTSFVFFFPFIARRRSSVRTDPVLPALPVHQSKEEKHVRYGSVRNPNQPPRWSSVPRCFFSIRYYTPRFSRFLSFFPLFSSPFLFPCKERDPAVCNTFWGGRWMGPRAQDLKIDQGTSFRPCSFVQEWTRNHSS